MDVPTVLRLVFSRFAWNRSYSSFSRVRSTYISLSPTDLLSWTGILFCAPSKMYRPDVAEVVRVFIVNYAVVTPYFTRFSVYYSFTIIIFSYAVSGYYRCSWGVGYSTGFIKHIFLITHVCVCNILRDI